MGLQLRRDFASLKKSDLFALLALMALSLLSMGGDGVLSLWAALTIPYVLLPLSFLGRDLRELEQGTALPLTPWERMSARYLLGLLFALLTLLVSGCGLLLYNGSQGRFPFSGALFLETLVLCVSLLGFSLTCPLLLLLGPRRESGIYGIAVTALVVLYNWFFRRTGILISSQKRTLLRGFRETLVPEALKAAAASARPYLLPAAALSAAVFLLSWLVSVWLFARVDEKVRMRPTQQK